MAANSPAAALGLRAGTVRATIDGRSMLLGGDVILSVLGVPIGQETYERRRERVRQVPPGSPVTVTVLRDGQPVTLSLAEHEREGRAGRVLGRADRPLPRAGAAADPLPRRRSRYHARPVSGAEDLPASGRHLPRGQGQSRRRGHRDPGRLGASFDLASEGEIDRCRGLAIPPGRFSFGNTVQRERAIATAYAEGIDLFAFDGAAELAKLARRAPGARVLCRILVRNVGAEWPLTRSFGCESRMAVDLLIEAKRQGLHPVGVSFHVGSQQTDPGAWAPAIAHAAWIFRACAHRGARARAAQSGRRAVPAQYRAPLPPLAAYAEAIETALTQEFGGSRPRVVVEPGRYLVGDAALLRTEILLVSRKSPHEHERWVYLDAGVYSGPDETLGERIHYRIRTPRDGRTCGPVILAGPTCDSTDILYAKSQYELPLDLELGDAVDFLSTGAYTASCAAVEFNGFPPIASHFV